MRDVAVHPSITHQAQEVDTPTTDFLCIPEGLQEHGFSVKGPGLNGLVNGHNALHKPTHQSECSDHTSGISRMQILYLQ